MPLRLAVFTIVIASLAGVTAAQAPPPAATGTAIIRGRVMAADTARPLRRTRITLVAPGAGAPRAVNTDTEGRYEITELAAGQYTITAARSGFLQLRYGQRRPLELAKPLDISDGQTIERVDFALPRTGLIAGRVTDEVGDPMGGVVIFAMRTEYVQGRRQLVPSGPPTSTDDAGQYRVIGLSPGTYVVRATSRETWTVTRDGKRDVMGFAPTYFPGTLDVKQSQPVTVGIAGHTSGTDFSMIPARPAKVSGTAFDSHGRPASALGLIVQAGGPNGGMVGLAGTRSMAADGSFVIRDVPPGEYTLKAVGSDEVATRSMVIGTADVEDVSIVTSAGWSASGSVTTEYGTPPDIPRERVRIAVNPVDAVAPLRMQGEPNYRLVLNDDWTFSVTGIVGAAKFRATLPDGWMVKSILQNGREVTDTAIAMKGGEELSGVQLIVTNRVTTVTAEITDSKGALLTDGTLVLFASDAAKWGEGSRFIRASRSNQQGQCRIKALPAGEYLAVALDDVQEGSWTDPAYLESIRRYAQKLTLNDGDSLAISLKLLSP